VGTSVCVDKAVNAEEVGIVEQVEAEVSTLVDVADASCCLRKAISLSVSNFSATYDSRSFW